MQNFSFNFFYIYVFFIIASVYSSPDKKSKVKTLYKWRYFDYDWQSPMQRNEFIRTGRYDYRNMTPIDVDISQGKNFFKFRYGDRDARLYLQIVLFELHRRKKLFK